MKYLDELKQALENEDFYKTDQILDKIKAEEDAKKLHRAVAAFYGRKSGYRLWSAGRSRTLYGKH